MPLESGKRINQFEIVEPLGSGAMGEVYRARDSRLDREIALKVLPESFIRDPERVGRFEREARTLASLDHPNIGALYDFQEADGMRFLVMQLIDGETLEDRINRGPLSVEEAIPIFVQIALGLEAAHQRGIIHRDLKPANVKLKPDGQVKVLDFGLAKSFGPEGEDSERDSSLTATGAAARLTSEQAILGTPSYMSPEQARARDVDRRSDIWAFGCTLFEALTGTPPFEGKTTADLIVRILRDTPDWSQLPPDVPASVKTILRRCLERDPRKRLKDAGDIAISLEEALASSGGSGAEPAPSAAGEAVRSAGARPFALTLAGLTVVLLGVIAAVYLGIQRPPAPETTSRHKGIPVVEKARAVRRFSITLSTAYPLKRPNPIIGDNVIAISPDGSTLVYVTGLDNDTQLIKRRLDQLDSTPIAGTAGAWNPFFSPDGKWIGFQQRSVADPKLMKIPSDGGVPIPLAPSPLPLGASWGEDDTIVFGHNIGAPLARVSAEGGAFDLLSVPDEQWRGYSEGFPQLLPEGRGIVFGAARIPHSDHGTLFYAEKPGGSRVKIADDIGLSYYVPSGHMVYPRTGALYALPFDLEAKRPTGPEVPVTESRMASAGTIPRQYCFSRDGDLIYVPESSQAESARTIVWVDRQGEETRVPIAARPFDTVRLSPDDSMLALDLIDLEDVWIYSLKRGTNQRLTFTAGSDYRPIWEPEGGSVIFLSAREGDTAIYSKGADGIGDVEHWVTNPEYPYPNDVSPDGRTLIYSPVATTSPVWVVEKGDPDSPRALFDGRHGEQRVRFSPDGKWISYESKDTGRYEIYVQSFPDQAAKFQISLEGGEDAIWSPLGDELFFWEGKVLMAVDVETEPTFSFGEPHPLFEMQSKVNYDVASDGQRFVIIKEGEASHWATELIVVENWFEELKRLAPAFENYDPS